MACTASGIGNAVSMPRPRVRLTQNIVIYSKNLPICFVVNLLPETSEGFNPSTRALHCILFIHSSIQNDSSVM